MTLRYLFLDMNSFFASVEQQESPELRGRPVGVVPVLAGSTCCIAASYEAKAYGVKTGTFAADAKVLCPDIRFALARPKIYVEYHHKIIDAAEQCLHVEDVCSIDEMYGRLYSNERDVKTAVSIAKKVKYEIKKACGEYVRCSIGIAPNVWTAKVATDLDKPDGLSIVDEDDIERELSTLELSDLPGIGSGMLARLRKRGIVSVRELFGLSQRELSQIWGSKIHGSEWWYKLRGFDTVAKETRRRTVSHSHVLAPEFRNGRDAYGVAIRMLHKAAYRLRKIGYWAERLSLFVRFMRAYPDPPLRYGVEVRIGPTRDTVSLARALGRLWQGVPRHERPLKVVVMLSDLVPDSAVSGLLFREQQKLVDLSDTIDLINNRYRANSVYLGDMHGYSRSAPERISFTQIPSLESFTNV